MPIILIQSEETYTVDETVFRFKRLRLRQQEELQYLYTIRGALDDVLYKQLCIAVALTGWDDLYGEHGLLAWPELAAGALSATTFAGMSEARKTQLEAVYAVVDALPLDVAYPLAQRVMTFAPEELKKSAGLILSADVALSTSSLDVSSIVSSVEATTATTMSAPPVTVGD